MNKEKFYDDSVYMEYDYWIVRQDMFDYDFAREVLYIKFCPFCGAKLQ
jgi:hypothetical protein